MSLRASQIQAEGTVEIQERKMGFVEALKKEKIAIHTQAANEQHYEVGSHSIFPDHVVSRCQLNLFECVWGLV